MLTAPLLKSVVVVGGGLAGLSAAIEAYRAGAAVTVLEKESRLGGNSAKATSGMNAALSPHQSSIGIQDSITAFRKRTMQNDRTIKQMGLYNSSKEIKSHMEAIPHRVHTPIEICH
ncbi:FAD binding domain-containing protein [Chytridium lagenaria]|nr:FAD binding domain-containing protein [Chytridium lagenaria]